MNHSTAYFSFCQCLLPRFCAKLHTPLFNAFFICVCNSSMPVDLDFWPTLQFWSIMLNLLYAWPVYTDFRHFNTDCDFWFTDRVLHLDMPLLSDSSIESSSGPTASPRTPATSKHTLSISLFLALLQCFRSCFLTMLPLSWHKKQKLLEKIKTSRKHGRKRIE